MRKSATKFERDKSNNQGDLVCRRPNCLESSGVNPLVKRVIRTCFGSTPLSLAVWIIVEIRDTFLVPWLERLPKVIFLKMTRFLKLLSALLLVGSTTFGYLRKVRKLAEKLFLTRKYVHKFSNACSQTYSIAQVVCLSRELGVFLNNYPNFAEK